jgi:hypothetical protein
MLKYCVIALALSLCGCALLQTSKPQKLVFVDSINKVAVPYGDGVGLITEHEIREHGYSPANERQREFFERRLATCFNRCIETRWTDSGGRNQDLNWPCNEACMRSDGWQLRHIPYPEETAQNTKRPPPSSPATPMEEQAAIGDAKIRRSGLELAPARRIQIPETRLRP